MNKFKLTLASPGTLAVPLTIVECHTIEEAAAQLKAEIRQLHSGWARVMLPDGRLGILQITVDEPYDVSGAIHRYDAGQLSSEEIIELFQYLVDSDLILQMNGRYGQTATRMILDAHIKPRERTI